MDDLISDLAQIRRENEDGRVRLTTEATTVDTEESNHQP